MLKVLELEDGAEAAGDASAVLEAGGLVVLRNRPFSLREEERVFLDPAILGKSKNVSFDPATGMLGGIAPDVIGQEALAAMLRRFSEHAAAVVAALAPGYAAGLEMRRTSFRPGPVDQRVLSPRKDDRRLHVDAFPANPVQGRRILRVFANVNPAGEARRWEVGEDDFAALATRFAPRLRRARPARLQQMLGVTRGLRTPYDQTMLDLHDLAKLDDSYQAEAPRRPIRFPPGAVWVVFTDAVAHAALSGQHALEQTFLLPVEAMAEPERSPLRTLERITGRRLI